MPKTDNHDNKPGLFLPEEKTAGHFPFCNYTSDLLFPKWLDMDK